jgi:hypothetical protein
VNKLLQKKCELQILKLCEHKDDRLRNELFESIKPHLIVIVKNLLKKYKRHETEPFIISMAWDVFENGVKNYKKGNPVAKHFSIQADFVFRKIVSEEKRLRKKLVYDSHNASRIDKEYDNIESIDNMMFLRDLRIFLPDAYKYVLDDSYKDYHGKIQTKKCKKEKPLPTNRYYEAKRIFEWLIEFIFMGKRLL